MDDRKISRREFIVLSSIGFAALMSPWKGVGSAFALPSGAAVIDPPPGDIFEDPPEIQSVSAQKGIVEVSLEAKMAPLGMGGSTVNLMTFNGHFPAPTIRVRKGDRIRVRFKNYLPRTDRKNILGHVKNVTNLHVHGWHVSPSGNSDNIFVHINPGEEFLYEYDTSKQEAGTLGHYHTHHHGQVSEQKWGGLSGGALVVEDETEMLKGIETHILILKDISIEGGSPAPYTKEDYIYGKEGDIVMVNGQVNPVLSIRPGQVQRWRILNASTARYYKLALEGHALHLIGTDGGLLDKPYPVSEILLTPGERIDVLIKADKGQGAYKFLSLPYDRKGGRIEKVTLMTVSCEGSLAKDRVPGAINPEAKRLDMDISTLPRKKLYFIMANGRGLVNLKDYDEEPYVHTSRVGTYEVWEIINISPMDHPFHQHINAAQILSIKGGDKGYASLYTSIPAWKDNINIPFGGSVTMLVPVMDFTGRTVLHCHIVEHEDIGMMGIWEIV